MRSYTCHVERAQKLTIAKSAWFIFMIFSLVYLFWTS